MCVQFKKENLKRLFRFLIAYFAMDKSKIPKNCLSEVWYITFTMLISTIKK